MGQARSKSSCALEDQLQVGMFAATAEWLARVIKAPTVNRIYESLKRLENDLIAVARRWSAPDCTRERARSLGPFVILAHNDSKHD